MPDPWPSPAGAIRARRRSAYSRRTSHPGPPFVESIAHTSYGALRGTRGGAVHVFRGIPFAAPPIGPRRFRPPERAARWSGARDAGRPGPAAPQGLGLLGPVFG